MLRSYLKIAARNLWKQKLFSGINIFGLAIGIALTLIVGAYIWKELQVNQQLNNIHNQYVIRSKWKDPNMGLEFTTIGPLAKALKEQYPHLVSNYYRMDGISSTVSKENKAFRELLQIGDSTLLTMYGFLLKYGDPESALEAPFSLVITVESALKYFNRENVVGETLTIESFSGEKRDFKITGVVDLPEQNSITHFGGQAYQFFIPENTLTFFGRSIEEWTNTIVLGYVELAEGIEPKDLQEPMEQVLQLNTPTRIHENLEPYLFSLQDYHLNDNKGMVRKMLYTLSGMAIFILLMAIINFVNITISQSSSRMREIGVRKVLGSLRKELIAQFYIETILLVILSTIIGIIVYLITKPFFESLLGKNLIRLFEFPPIFIGIVGVFIILISLIAGAYPSLLLSSYKSVDSLKGKLNAGNERIWLRKGLVGFQFFTASIVLITSFIVSKQIWYFFNTDLGYDKNYIVSVDLPRNWTREGVNKMNNIRDQFAALPETDHTTLSYQVPNGNNPGQILIYKLGTDSTQAISAEVLITDEYYASTYGIQMVAGTFFNEPGAFEDYHNIVINEKQAQAFGWKDPKDAINQKIRFINNPYPHTIKGVIKDYHYSSLHTAIQPIVFRHVNAAVYHRYLSFKIKPGNINRSLTILERKWSILLPGTPFNYTFMDETLAKLYQTELQLEKAAHTVTVLAIIIAILGVFGLVAINIQKRTKEIGIRKVVGASTYNVTSLFLKDFLPVLITASIIACPVAYWIMLNWLNQYEYSISITFEPFVITIAVLGIITSVLIGIQSIKAALVNPIESLRQE